MKYRRSSECQTSGASMDLRSLPVHKAEVRQAVMFQAYCNILLHVETGILTLFSKCEKMTC